MGLGHVAELEGDDATARPLMEQGLALAQDAGDTRHTAGVLNSLGRIAHRQGDHVEALSFARRSLALAREAGLELMAAHQLLLLSRVTCSLGDAQKARDFAEKSLRLFREAGVPGNGGEAQAQWSLAAIARLTGDPTSAVPCYRESLRLFHEL